MDNSGQMSPGEKRIERLLLACALFTILVTVGILWVLGSEAFSFFFDNGVDLVGFLTGTRWQPQTGEFGLLPLISSTLLTSGIALLVAIPIGFGTAVYLAEYASQNMRARMKPLLELLASVPSITYALFAIFFVTPFLQSVFGEGVSFYNRASAGLVTGVLILPLITTMCEDAISSVPQSLRNTSYTLGANRFETVMNMVVPSAMSGILASFIIGFSRAAGETMVAAIAAGSGSNFSWNPFASGETITGYIIRISGGDISYNSIDYTSLFALGFSLFIFTFILNIISVSLSRRLREKYQR